MSSEFMRNVADVLEKVAEHLDNEQYQQQETVRQQREELSKALNEKYAAVTGEELSAEVLEHMSNEKLRLAFEKLTEKTAASTISDEEPEEMGRGANIDTRADLSKRDRVKQAAADADEGFLNWVME